VKPAPFGYARPRTLEEALEALADDPGAKVLAGGQSLVPLLSMRLASPSRLVDIGALPGLDHVTSDRDGVRVGALARHADVLADAGARATQPLLALALAHVAHATIRNRGTTVGSIVHADAAAELPAVLRLLGGTVEVASVRGRRTIGAEDLFVGPLETSLARDELALEAFFPALAAGEGVAFDEVARRHGDYASCGVAALVSLGRPPDGAVGDDGGLTSLARARAAYVSVEDVPTVVELTGALAGPVDRLGDDAYAGAGEAALVELDPQADLHASAAYRGQLVRVLTARVLRAAVDDARERAGRVS
jgi:2-furoyl-CoA dehydrogenase FAD binding subunit